jgi:hypothetical protein
MHRVYPSSLPAWLRKYLTDDPSKSSGGVCRMKGLLCEARHRRQDGVTSRPVRVNPARRASRRHERPERHLTWGKGLLDRFGC